MTTVLKQIRVPDTLKNLFLKFKKKDPIQDISQGMILGDEGDLNSSEDISSISGKKPSPELSDYIAGELSDFKDELSPVLPSGLIAGEVPYVAGMEKDAVWNAAAQACATEKVHFSYAVDLVNQKVSYLACPSISLASTPDSWCPLVTALPGNPEFIDKETTYVYEQDATVAALRWSEESQRIQLFVGANRTILPKIQSMDSNFVTIGQDNSHVISWKNQQLKTEKLSRAFVRTLFLSGLAISILLIVVLLIESFSLFFTQKDLKKVEKETKASSSKLVENSYKAMHSDILIHSVRIQQLLAEIHKADGFLTKYEISKGKVMWEALIPAAYPYAQNSILNGKRVEEEDRSDGRIRIQGTR